MESLRNRLNPPEINLGLTRRICAFFGAVGRFLFVTPRIIGRMLRGGWKENHDMGRDAGGGGNNNEGKGWGLTFSGMFFVAAPD